MPHIVNMRIIPQERPDEACGRLCVILDCSGHGDQYAAAESFRADIMCGNMCIDRI